MSFMPSDSSDFDPLEIRHYGQSVELSPEEDAQLQKAIDESFTSDSAEPDSFAFKWMLWHTRLDEKDIERLFKLEQQGQLSYEQVEGILWAANNAKRATTEVMEDQRVLLESVVELIKVAEERPVTTSDLASLIEHLHPAGTALHMSHLLSAGILLERARLQLLRPLIRDGKSSKKSRAAGGRASGETTVKERALIVKHRDMLVRKDDRSKAKAAVKVCADLANGEFPGIDRSVALSPEYVARLTVEH